MTTVYTANLSITEPGVGDAATTNAWGGLTNTNWVLVDSAVAGQLVLSVAGSSNVVLSYTAGSPDQERNQDFIFTGALTGNIAILWPQSQQRMFTVFNNTTGNFNLSVGNNNGSGSLAGIGIAVPQGFRAGIVLDGVNASWRNVPIKPSNGSLAPFNTSNVTASLVTTNGIYTGNFSVPSSGSGVWQTILTSTQMNSFITDSINSLKINVMATTTQNLDTISEMNVYLSDGNFVSASVKTSTLTALRLDGSNNLQAQLIGITNDLHAVYTVYPF